MEVDVNFGENGAEGSVGAGDDHAKLRLNLYAFAEYEYDLLSQITH